MHEMIPMLVSIKCNRRGEKLLCLHRPGTKSQALIRLYVRGLNLERHWGRLSSTNWVVELSVPGYENAACNVLLVLDTYDSMQRIARMALGRELPDSTLQIR